MLESTFQVLQTFFAMIWSLFTGFYVPGFNVTPAAFLMFGLVVFVTLQLIKYIRGL